MVGAELFSSAFDYTDAGRDMAVLFADGGGAAVLEGHEETGAPPRGLISHHLHSDGTAIDALYGEIWGSSTFPPVSKKKIDDGRTRPRMNGRAVFVHAVRRVREVVQECLDANGLLADDIDLFIFHQANLRIVESMAESFKIPQSRMLQQHPALRQHRGRLGAHLPARGGDGRPDEGGRPRHAGRLRHRLLLGGDAPQVVRRRMC